MKGLTRRGARSALASPEADEPLQGPRRSARWTIAIGSKTGEKLEVLAPLNVLGRHSRRAALLLAGQKGHHLAGHLSVLAKPFYSLGVGANLFARTRLIMRINSRLHSKVDPGVSARRPLNQEPAKAERGYVRYPAT